MKNYSRVLHIRNRFSGFSILFWDSSLLFYPLFSQKLSVSVSYNVRDSTVSEVNSFIIFGGSNTNCFMKTIIQNADCDVWKFIVTI